MLSFFILPSKVTPAYVPPTLLECIPSLESPITHTSTKMTREEEKRLEKIRLENSLFDSSQKLSLASFQEKNLQALIRFKIGKSENEYVQFALFNYLRDKIEELLKANDLKPLPLREQKIKKICCILIEEALKIEIPYAKLPHYPSFIERITLESAIRYRFKRNPRLKAEYFDSHPLGFELGLDLDPHSFAKYMDQHCRISVPYTMPNHTIRSKRYNPSEFIAESIKNIRDEYHAPASLKELINNIKEKINEYEKENKIAIVNAFNREIESIEKNLYTHSEEENLEELKVLLGNIQKNEDGYYKPICLFYYNSIRWKENSTLQPKINEASQLLQKYIEEYIEDRTTKNIRDEYHVPASLKELINNIKEKINEYEKENKIAIISAFNRDIARIEKNLYKHSEEENLEELKVLLGNIQKNEDGYYKPISCFYHNSVSWKEKSTLQPKINEASQLLQNYLENHHELSKPSLEDKDARSNPSNSLKQRM